MSTHFCRNTDVQVEFVVGQTLLRVLTWWFGHALRGGGGGSSRYIVPGPECYGGIMTELPLECLLLKST